MAAEPTAVEDGETLLMEKPPVLMLPAPVAPAKVSVAVLAGDALSLTCSV